jgi:hypothetical protein
VTGPVAVGACTVSCGPPASVYTRYQPASRYWPFQVIEAGVLALVVGVTLGAGVWAMRRRMP